MAIIWNTWIAKCADEYRIERSKRVVAARRHRSASLEVVISAPRQLFEVNPAQIAENASRFCDDLAAYPIAGYHSEGARTHVRPG
jgi:hypothetical protein